MNETKATESIRNKAHDSDIGVERDDSIERELETRLVETLDDFVGGDPTTYADEGIDGRGLVLRILVEGRMIEVNVSIKDVTAELQGARS